MQSGDLDGMFSGLLAIAVLLGLFWLLVGIGIGWAIWG